MADVKISGLPGSSTPLAGTEVLPIVQSGVTKQVSVANLTSGRDVAAKKLQPTDNVEVASGKGIDFAAAGGDVLTQYDEGTCSLTVSSTVGTITSSSTTAIYTRIGRAVTVTGSVTITNNGTGADTLLLGDLPFTPNGAACGVGRESVNNGKTCALMVSGGSKTVSVNTYDNAYPVSTNSVIQFTITYTV